MTGRACLAAAALLLAAACRQPATGPRFTNPTAITNAFLPLAGLHVDTLKGPDGNDTLLIVRSVRTDTSRTFTVHGRSVTTLTMEDREYVNGELEEVTLDYFAQADDSTVYYFGEDVDDYENGQVVGHSGAWLYGVQMTVPGIVMPGRPAVGQTFYLESVPGTTVERDSVVSLTETVTVPAGTFINCLKIQEDIGGGVLEYKYYASGIGVVREETPDGIIDLQSQR
jgi:hypothetical protein